MSSKKQSLKNSSVKSKQLPKIKEIHNKYVYEVSIYIIDANSAECHNTKFYASNKPIDEKTICVDYNNKKVVKFIELVAAPEDYLIAHNYTPYKV